MKPLHMVPLAVAIAAAGPAHADPESLNPDAFDLSGALDRPVASTRPGFEVALAGGYTQGVGGAGAIGTVQDLTGPGGAVELQLAYRRSARFSTGVYGTLAWFHHGEAIADGSRTYGATAGVQAVWHGSDTRALDPWVSIGAGWRGLWVTYADARPSAMHGIELLRVQLGIDYRFSPRLAIAPVVAASLSVFLVENAVMPEFTSVQDKRLNLYGFTGLLGRFDLGG
ncbi:MAG: hypothetical protein E6J91_04740 [Deltaproteobacteria bacterium]|nr:MAG: hypothetical protein E6J91_04740 [Deltaproteobacteria bacterium]